MDETSSPQQLNSPTSRRARWRAVTDLFDRCLGATDEEQELLLANAEGWLAIEVRSLLENAGDAEEGWSSPAEQLLNAQANLPEQIGAYRIQRLLGQGGMGSVFLAHRIGEFDQLVAVKLIRRDFGSAAHGLEKRFRQERQILASLQHPYIAHLIDGGTSGGQPYLVVEYIPGVRIDEYCNAHCLSIRHRIELFLKVCAAVQYAHQNLIIHRDLKPANVLVQEDGTPKLLDFGVAKLLHEGDRTPDMTRTAMRIFTPGYASPEQLRGNPIGTAGDVYSLGVMLYELLTGQRPHLVKNDSDLAMLDAICNEEPANASVAIKRYTPEERELRSAERSTNFSIWERGLRGDLSLIVATAVTSEASRRYASAEQFSSDLARCLADQPILARKDSWTYRTTKFWNRHKSLVSVGLLSLVLLLAAGGALWREYAIAIQQRQRAERRFNDLRTLARSNLTEVQTALDHLQGGTEVRSLILGRTLQYLDSLAAEKDNDVELQRNLASAYMLLAEKQGNPGTSNLGDFAGAKANYDRSIRIRESILTSPRATEKDRFDLIYLRYEVALMQAGEGKYEAARQTLAQAVTDSEAMSAAKPRDTAGAIHYVCLSHKALADVLFDGSSPSLADPVQGLRHAEIAMQAAEQLYKIDPKNQDWITMLLVSQQGVADKLFASGRYEEGMQLQRAIIASAESARGALFAKDNDLFIHTWEVFAGQLAKKNPRAALPWAEKTLAAISTERDADPLDIRMAGWYASELSDFGNIYRLAGDRKRGLQMMAGGIARASDMLAKSPAAAGDLYYPLAAAHRNLADDALQLGNLQQALLEYQKADAILAEDSAAIPDDLQVYAKRSENELSIAATETRLGRKKDAAISKALAIEYADRVLRRHPDNQVVQVLKTSAAR